MEDTLFIGRYFSGEGSREFLPVSTGELLRSQHMVERMLSTFDIARGRFVLLISQLEDGAYAIPVERAIMNLGLLVTNADDSPYDGPRIQSICSRFDVAAVIGVTAQVIAGFDDAGCDLGVLAGRIVFAFPDAHDRLSTVPGIILRSIEMFGPALGIECREGAGLHIDSCEWDCVRHESDLVLSSRLGRALPIDRYAIPGRGNIEQAPCGCGNTDIRIAARERAEAL